VAGSRMQVDERRGTGELRTSQQAPRAVRTPGSSRFRGCRHGVAPGAEGGFSALGGRRSSGVTGVVVMPPGEGPSAGVW